MTYGKLYDKIIASGLKNLQLNRDYIIAETKRLVHINWEKDDKIKFTKQPSTSYRAIIMKQVMVQYNRHKLQQRINRKNKIQRILK